MATVYKRLQEITTIAATATAYVTNPSNTKTFVSNIVLHNTNSVAETIEIYVVPDNSGSVGTATASNRMWKDDLDPNVTRIVPLPKIGIVLEDANDTIQILTTTAGKVTVQIFGRQDT